jgi:hypothetical protein
VEQFKASGKKTVFVTINHASLENVKEATALSYCWGDPTDQKPIFANGKLLYIPSSLWIAIRWEYPQGGLVSYKVAGDLNTHRGPPIFWADAICINQEDTVEKNHQIPLMRSIYGNARHVLVYVGEGEEGFGAALLTEIISQTAKEFAPWTIVPDKVIRGMAKMDWQAVRQFLSQQVFRRSWIIQEIVLAKNLTIVEGMTSIGLDQIFNCVRAIRMNHVRHVDSLLGFPGWTVDQSQEFTNATIQLYNLANIRSQRQEGNTVSFLEVLENFRHSKATDPRDKVYSLLSLASEAYRNSIIPDYSPSNTVTSVFLCLAKCAVTIGDIELLLRNAGGSQTVSGLPSWVPDWTCDSRNIIPSDQYACGGVERTCQASLSSTNSQIRLTIRGLLFDTIRRKHPMLDRSSHGNLPDTFGTISAAILIVYYLLSSGSTVVDMLGGIDMNGDDLLTAVWQTLVCGLGWNGKRTTDSDKRHFNAFLTRYQGEMIEMLASSGRSFLVSIGTKVAHNQAELEESRQQPPQDTRYKALTNETIPALSPEQEQRAQLEDEMYPFLATMLYHQSERRTCVTLKRFLGTIPSDAKEGDVIAIFFGLRTPFVLRPLAGGTYKLIGPCYVHGIMDGQGLPDNDKGIHGHGLESMSFILV